ncbi:acetylglutamate kinase [Methylophilaceae bacterium]|jgi:acetylglutamate kinase|nr:acetylglutamate kinase [Nitrosomonadales bacterium]MCH9781663.1 acetylglutamate kinase [Betaproteobacteria bacterium]MDA9085523.1 acetylglutamate kinase [Methylophilaceae bacterium]MDA9097011.1 acetylglutamate kinase [Methylophilaceae bacterium]|tara:strand:- start:396 stop:1253 length:858 start_codon:yes stop_codon:yes gene_type:complete
MTPNDKAKILSEALPYIKKFYGKTMIIKYGGNAMIDEELKHSFAKDVVLLKLVGMNPVIVHGGGPQINERLNKIGKDGVFHKGMRVTDEETMEVVHEVLASISTEIVDLIKKNGGKANSLSQKKSKSFIRAKKLTDASSNIDLGYVGDIDSIDPFFMSDLSNHGVIPIIAPIGYGIDNKIYNINADVVAGKLAEVVNAEKLVLMTNTKGVLDIHKNLITGLVPKEIEKMIADGSLSGGMLPKINAALHAAKSSVSSVHIIDGRVQHALLLEILTDQGVGTLIKSH